MLLSSLDLTAFRGITTGALQGLRQVTLVTGANGAGKSTLLEALYVAAHPDPAVALTDVLHRAPVGGAARFLVPAHTPTATCKLKARGPNSVRALAFAVGPGQEDADGPPPHHQIDLQVRDPNTSATAKLQAAADNSAQTVWAAAPPPLLPAVHWIRARPGNDRGSSLERAWSDATLRGVSPAVIARVREVAPIEDLQMVLDRDGTPRLFALSGGADLPLPLLGQGIAGFAWTALQLLSAPKGLVLLDGPAPDAHPRLLWELARLIWDLAADDRQIVIATQRLDLVDAMLATATRAQGEQISLRRLALRDGHLAVSALDGDDLAFSRNLVEDDLR